MEGRKGGINITYEEIRNAYRVLIENPKEDITWKT
jgi:hypothetical protein